MNDLENLKRTVQLIKELQEIGYLSVDKEKSKGEYKNILGQKILIVELLENSPGLFSILSNGEKKVNPRVREIGEELFNIGGFELMQKAYYEVIKPFGVHGQSLSYAWESIGGWQN